MEYKRRVQQEKAKVASRATVQLSFAEEYMDQTDVVDVAIVVALEEEFQELHQILGKPIGQGDQHTGTYHYPFERKLANGRLINGIAVYAGMMGPTKSAIVTTVITERYRPRILVNVGIAGALSDDVCVGDVVVASVVDMYRENSREEPGRWVPAGEPYRTTKDFLEIAKNIKFSHENEWQSWLTAANGRSQAVVEAALAQCQYEIARNKGSVSLHIGHIASGSSLGASKDFKGQLLNRDRSYLALEMESGGVVAAVYEYLRTADSLVIKGVSDFADERKKFLDRSSKGRLRQIAMESAVDLIWKLLDIRNSSAK